MKNTKNSKRIRTTKKRIRSKNFRKTTKLVHKGNFSSHSFNRWGEKHKQNLRITSLNKRKEFFGKNQEGASLGFQSLHSHLRGGNSVLTHIIDKVNTKYPDINTWKFDAVPVPIKMMLKKTNISTDSDLGIFGIDWGENVVLEPVSSSQKQTKIYTLSKEGKIHDVLEPNREMVEIFYKKLIYIKLYNGPIFMCTEIKNGGHQEIIHFLNQCNVHLLNSADLLNSANSKIINHPMILFCQVAGEIHLDEMQNIVSWNCQSGTFAPKCGIVKPLYTNIAELPADKYKESGAYEVIFSDDIKYSDSSKSGITTGRSGKTDDIS